MADSSGQAGYKDSAWTYATIIDRPTGPEWRLNGGTSSGPEQGSLESLNRSVLIPWVMSSPASASKQTHPIRNGSLYQDASAVEVSDAEEEDDEDNDRWCSTDIRNHERKPRRFRLTRTQTRYLMSEFARQPRPDAAHRERLSREIAGLTSRQVQVWFQNRRAKMKRFTDDDRQRMMSARALPADFDMAATLRTPPVISKSISRRSVPRSIESRVVQELTPARRPSHKMARQHSDSRLAYLSSLPNYSTPPANAGPGSCPVPGTPYDTAAAARLRTPSNFGQQSCEQQAIHPCDSSQYWQPRRWQTDPGAWTRDVGLNVAEPPGQLNVDQYSASPLQNNIPYDFASPSQWRDWALPPQLPLASGNILQSHQWSSEDPRYRIEHFASTATGGTRPRKDSRLSYTCNPGPSSSGAVSESVLDWMNRT